eukprot:g7929.t1
MKATFSEPVVRNPRRRCSVDKWISPGTPLSTVLNDSNRCSKSLLGRRPSTGVIAKGAGSVFGISTADNTVLYFVVRTFSRLQAYDINITLDSSIADFSGNGLTSIPLTLRYYRPVIGMPSRERLNRIRKRQIQLSSPPSYASARTAGRVATAAVVTSCVSSLASSASTGSSGGSTALIMNVQTIHMTGLIAVTNMPDGYKNFTNEIGWAMLDIDTPWRYLRKRSRSSSSEESRGGRRSLKQFDFVLEAEDDEGEAHYFERIIFWAPTIFIAVIILHVVFIWIYLVKQWELPDLLQPPRIELLIGFFLLPPIAVAAAGLYQGSRGEAILATWIIIAIPVNFLCWNLFMLWYYILRLPPHLREANQIADIPSQRQRAIRKLRTVVTFARNLSTVASGNTGHRTASSIALVNTGPRTANSVTSGNTGHGTVSSASSNVQRPPPVRNSVSEIESVNGVQSPRVPSTRLQRSDALYQYQAQPVNAEGQLEDDSYNEPLTCAEFYRLLSSMNWMTLLFGEQQSEAEWSSTRQQGSKFVARFGPLFEEHRGPAIGRKDATLQIDPITGRVDRGTLVVIQERPLLCTPSLGKRGSYCFIPRTKIYRYHLQILAKLVDMSKTILVGCIVAGVGNSNDNLWSIVALVFLSFTLLFLFRLAKPFPSRVDMLVLLITELADLIVYLFAVFLLIGPDVGKDTYDKISVTLIVSESFSMISMMFEYALFSIGLGMIGWEEWQKRREDKFFNLVYQIMMDDGRYLSRKYFDRWMVIVFKRGLNGRELRRHELPWKYVFHQFLAQTKRNCLWLYHEANEIVIDAKAKYRTLIT